MKLEEVDVGRGIPLKDTIQIDLIFVVCGQLEIQFEKVSPSVDMEPERKYCAIRPKEYIDYYRLTKGKGFRKYKEYTLAGVINPKNPQHWETVQSLRRNELLNVYAGGFADTIEEKTANAALRMCLAFFEGRKLKTPDLLLKGKYSFKNYSIEEDETPAPRQPTRRRSPIRASSGDSHYEQEINNEPEQTKEAPSQEPPVQEQTGGSRRMTPTYSVPVTNELFHNGNVEAWKKIIQSYETTYPGSEVSVFYEGERIHDINTLFKWGKVKHGSTILFAVLGTEIKDVAKLQRYLRQGASPQFEAFLKFPVNNVLKLF
jgi:hypothetical protein